MMRFGEGGFIKWSGTLGTAVISRTMGKKQPLKLPGLRTTGDHEAARSATCKILHPSGVNDSEWPPLPAPINYKSIHLDTLLVKPGNIGSQHPPQTLLGLARVAAQCQRGKRPPIAKTT